MTLLSSYLFCLELRHKTYSYFPDPDSIENWTHKLGNKTHVEAELKKAFAAWSRHSGLRFVRAEGDGLGASRGDISVAFGRYAHGDNYPFDGPGEYIVDPG